MLCEVAYSDILKLFACQHIRLIYKDILELETPAMLDDIPKPSDTTIIKLKGKYSPDPEHLGFISLFVFLQTFPNSYICIVQCQGYRYLMEK